MSRLRLPRHQRHALDSGLQVLVVPQPARPAVAASLLVRAGGMTDPGGEEGCTALVASMLNQGSQGRDADALAVAVDELGATFNASTGWESFSGTVVGLSEDLDALTDLLAEIALAPSFPEDQFETMRARRRHGVIRRLDDSSVLADWTFVHHLYGKHPYGRPLGGTVRSIEGLDVQQVRRRHAALMQPGNAILALAGDLDPEIALQAARRSFGGWSPAAAAPQADLALPGNGRGPALVAVHREDLTQAQIRWGHPGICRGDDRHDTAQVMNYPLGGGGFASRLMQHIRSEKGWTYGVSSSFDARLQPGPFFVSTFTPNERVGDVLEAIDSVVARYREEGPTPAELEAAKSYAIGSYPLRFESAAQVASRLLEADLYGLPAERLEDFPERIAALGHDDIVAAARGLLRPEEAQVVVVGNAEVFGPALAARGEMQRFDARDAFGSTGAA